MLHFMRSALENVANVIGGSKNPAEKLGYFMGLRWEVDQAARRIAHFFALAPPGR